MYKIKITCGERTSEIQGIAGITSPRCIQKLAAALFGDGAKIAISAPAIGLYCNDVARA